ncbi:MAG TPA: potassium channel protein [Actinomycetota bacterium]|nr:potassium channel protein [Actinomycetota bacterium]
MADSPGRDLWRRVRWPALAVVLALAYGVAGYMLLEGWRFLDALYMTVTTLTTVGFREVRPLDDGGMVFTLTVITIGVGLVLTTVTAVAQWVLEGQWGERTRRHRMQRRIDDLTGHFIVCAYGRVGRAVARELEGQGASFVVVDPDERLLERMRDDGVAYLIDDPSHETVLHNAGVERARGLVCAVDSDATNVFIALVARALNPDLFIVARASEPGSDQRLLRAGANRVVSPFVSSGRHMALVAMRPSADDVVALGTSGAASMELEEVRVDQGSLLEGMSVGQALGSTPVLAVRHAGGQIIPNPPADLQLRQGDLVLLLGESDLSSLGSSSAPPEA